jgi:hypothetical protein
MKLAKQTKCNSTRGERHILMIRAHLICVFDAFWRADTRYFHAVNQALMTLIPKMPKAKAVKDYRLISLIHILGKLFSKMLVSRLVPKLGGLVQPNQGAFIKGRMIHNNFKFVQAATRLLHVRKLLTLLLKVDIAHAFDSVSWSFLLEVHGHMGFPRPWWDWISTLLATASTRVLLNGSPGDIIPHARGLQQGDRLSPMLFILVMEVLNALIYHLQSRCWIE